MTDDGIRQRCVPARRLDIWGLEPALQRLDQDQIEEAVEHDLLSDRLVGDVAFPTAATSLGGLARAAADQGIRRAVLLSGRGEPDTHAAEQAA